MAEVKTTHEETPAEPAAESRFRLSELIDQIEAGHGKPMAELREWAITRRLSVEGETRRGLIAMNGAGLIAVVSLLSPLGEFVTHIAAWAYFTGIILAMIGWYIDASIQSTALRVSGITTEWRKAITTHPVLDNMTPADAGVVLPKVLAALSRTKRINTLAGKVLVGVSIVSASCFVAATLALMVAFQLSPPITSSTAAQAPASQSVPPKRPVVAETMPKVSRHDSRLARLKPGN